MDESNQELPVVYHGMLSKEVNSNPTMRDRVVAALFLLAGESVVSRGGRPPFLYVVDDRQPDNLERPVLCSLFRWDVWETEVEPRIGRKRPSLKLLPGGGESPGGGDSVA